MNFRTDFVIDTNKNYKIKEKLFNKSIKVLESNKNNSIYHTIIFKDIYESTNIIKVLKKELLYFLNLYKINKTKHIFIIGLGNESNTADSIGPKVLKHINVNSHLFNLGMNINHIKISALEPGVLGTTGIDTAKIIKSVCEYIKPDLVILIDSFVTNNINYLNKTIEISNTGIKPGSGLRGNNSEISKTYLKTPIITIGVPTAIEYKSNNNSFLVSTSDIDEYIYMITEILGKSINNVFYHTKFL